MLQTKKLVNGIKFQHNDSESKEACDGCMKGKQTRKSFPKESTTRAHKILELIHTDVCGPMENKSLGGSRYFVTFIDDKSRYTAIYFMKQKNEVFEKYKEFEAMVENVTGKKIRALRSDNGGEYSSKAFNNYLQMKGVQRQFTLPRNPQQNGVAERMHRTLQESARSMIHGGGLKDEFWAEAVQTTAILRSRSPTTAVNEMTPYECFVGSKPNVSNLKVFRCTAYMQIPKELRKKWDAKSKRCIFIGYCIRSKGYRLWDPVSQSVYLSRDVIFFEQDFNGRVERLKEQSESEDSSKFLSEDYESKAEDTSNDGNNDDNEVAEEVLLHNEGNLCGPGAIPINSLVLKLYIFNQAQFRINLLLRLPSLTYLPWSRDYCYFRYTISIF